jgi:predicted dehydrogenase
MSETFRKLRMGMVGGGQGAFIGAVHRTAAVLDHQIELVAGCFSRDYENTKKTGAELALHESRLYRSFEEMAEKEAALPEEKRIDFVSVVTPNKTHYPISAAFLEKGFHVVCDKPMTFDVTEAEQLVRLVEATGLVFCLTHNYTGTPVVREARRLFSTGEMGEVRKIVAEYLQDWLMEPLEKEGGKQAVWRTDPSQAGAGGALGDIGTHAMNLLEYVTGDEVLELCADTSTFLPDRILDEDANILIRLKGGGRGVITISQIATGEENGLRLKAYASKGGVMWQQEHPNMMEVYRHGEPKRIYTRASGYLGSQALAGGRVPPGHPEGYLEAFANIYRGAAEAIRRHRAGSPMKSEEYEFPTVYDGLRGMKFIQAAVDSAAGGGVWTQL